MFRIQIARLALVPLLLLGVGCATPIPEPEISVQVNQPTAYELGQSIFVERHDKDEFLAAMTRYAEALRQTETV